MFIPVPIDYNNLYESLEKNNIFFLSKEQKKIIDFFHYYDNNSLSESYLVGANAYAIIYKHMSLYARVCKNNYAKYKRNTKCSYNIPLNISNIIINSNDTKNLLLSSIRRALCIEHTQSDSIFMGGDITLWQFFAMLNLNQVVTTLNEVDNDNNFIRGYLISYFIA